MQSNNNCDTESIRLWELYSEITATTHSHNINQYKVSYSYYTHIESIMFCLFFSDFHCRTFFYRYIFAHHRMAYTLHHLYHAVYIISVCSIFSFLIRYL